MFAPGRRSRMLLVAGLILMLAGALDPLEGAVVILTGSGLATAGAILGDSRWRRLHVAAFVLIGIGVAVLFGLSAVGGVGGTTGRSGWWLVMCVPYPVGWVIGLVAAAAALRAARYSPA